MAKSKEEIREYHRRYSFEHRESINASSRRSYQRFRDQRLQSQRKYREKNKERINASQRKYKENNKEKVRIGQRAYLVRLKSEMVQAYGSVCACCKESNLRFLTLDHINRDGQKDRQKYGGGWRLWYSLKQRGWPNYGYRILCWNCNMAVRYGDPCPHEAIENVSSIN